jgi:hypothetical protein
MTNKIEIDNSIYIANIMFPNDLCDMAIDIFNQKEELLKNYKIFNHEKNGLDRKDNAIFVDDLQMDMFFEAGNVNLCIDINTYLNEALLEYVNLFGTINSMELRSIRQKLQKTKKGGGYHKWHHEQTDTDSASRVLVWSIYLNDVEEGGETEFLHQSKRIKAKKGKILIFPASFTHTHRGNPPLSGDKYILTGWWNLY